MTAVNILQAADRHAGGADLDQIDAAIAAATAALTTRSALPPAAAVEAELLASLAAGDLSALDVLPDTVRARLVEAPVRVEVGRILAVTIADLKARRAFALGLTADEALRFLDGELQVILAAVRQAAPPLAGIEDANEAIRRGPAAVKAWTTVDRMVGAYRELRQAQLSITRRVVDADQVRAFQFVAGITRGAPDDWPGRTLTPPGVLPTTSPVPYLVWLASRDDCYVPTAGEFEEAIEELNSATPPLS